MLPEKAIAFGAGLTGAGVRGVKLPFRSMLYKLTVLDPWLAAAMNEPPGLMAIALVFEPAANEPIPMPVRVPSDAIEKALMLLEPVFATYPNFPFGELIANPGCAPA